MKNRKFLIIKHNLSFAGLLNSKLFFILFCLSFLMPVHGFSEQYGNLLENKFVKEKQMPIHDSKVPDLKKLAKTLKNIKINAVSRPREELEYLVWKMLKKNPTVREVESTLMEAHALNSEDAGLFYQMLRHQRVKQEAEKSNSLALVSMLPFIDKFSLAANQESAEYYGIPLHRQPVEIQESLLIQAFRETISSEEYLNTLESNGLASAFTFCPSESFPQWFPGISTSSYDDASNVTRVQNSWDDIPCDYKIWYPSEGSLVTGSTASANNLIIAFGAGLHGKNEGGKTNLIVGALRANLSGFWSNDLKSEIKLVK